MGPITRHAKNPDLAAGKVRRIFSFMGVIDDSPLKYCLAALIVIFLCFRNSGCPRLSFVNFRSLWDFSLVYILIIVYLMVPERRLEYYFSFTAK